MIKKRWGTRELSHLVDHMKMLEIDIKNGNKASALTNWAMAMGIINKLIEKGKQKRKIVRTVSKGLEIAIKIAVQSAIQELKKNGKL